MELAPQLDNGHKPLRVRTRDETTNYLRFDGGGTPNRGDRRNSGRLGFEATSAKAFQRIAVQATALNKVLLAQKLNERGRPKHTYKVGDKVTFFRPPSEAEAKTAGRKPSI